MKECHDIIIERESKQMLKCKFEDCDYTSDRRMNLNKHMKYRCKYRNLEFKCNFKDCNFTTTSSIYLKGHIKKIHKQR